MKRRVEIIYFEWNKITFNDYVNMINGLASVGWQIHSLFGNIKTSSKGFWAYRFL